MDIHDSWGMNQNEHEPEKSQLNHGRLGLWTDRWWSTDETSENQLRQCDNLVPMYLLCVGTDTGRILTRHGRGTCSNECRLVTNHATLLDSDLMSCVDKQTCTPGGRG